MNRPRFALISSLILAAAASRIIPHPPIAALALFGGAQFLDKRLAFLVPLAALFLSDLVMGLHSQMPGVYTGFALVVCIGFALRGRLRALPVAAASLAGSVVFFLVSNLGVWATGAMYPKSIAGLGACYAAGIPFFRNSLLGDAFYAAVLFGAFALAEKRFAVLREPALAAA